MEDRESLKESQKLCGDGTWDGTAEDAGESCLGIKSRTQSMEVGLGDLNSSQKQTLAQTPHDYPHLMEGKTTVTEEANCLLESMGRCAPQWLGESPVKGSSYNVHTGATRQIGMPNDS